MVPHPSPSGRIAGHRRRIGLFGGSFNPPHEGHRHASLLAWKRLALDEVWWLVSPVNPLKETGEFAPYEERCAAARKIARHPRIKISTFERDAGLIYTRDTLRALIRAQRDVCFVWLMGADNLASIHRWNRWPEIFELVPVAVIDRPSYRLRAMSSPAALRYADRRIDEEDARLLAGLAPPVWCFLSGPLSLLSSSRLRRHGPRQRK
ncbi:MAG: nicotinate-nucleotide adenylyltransferase [Hyphomicrobiales bacterium]|nr:nicotinate-nucleotide adenylyltransferase [Hyphomicrobiales bacterium]